MNKMIRNFLCPAVMMNHFKIVLLIVQMYTGEYKFFAKISFMSPCATNSMNLFF